jgi:hypothetical protein
MTNGEKIKEIFPNRVLTSINNSYYWGDDILVSKSFWNAEYKEPSSSGKPNKSIEEKCPCYYCEHFEIKGLSHCEIHEEAYGDSRCNDYHKINQKPNKSEIPTDSTTKNDLGVDAVSRKELLKKYEDKFFELQKLKHLKNNKGAEYRQLGINYCINILKELPPVTPQEPMLNKLKEQDEPKAVRYEGDGYADGAMVYDMALCPNCEHVFEEDSENWECDFCPNCGQKLRWEE